VGCFRVVETMYISRTVVISRVRAGANPARNTVDYSTCTIVRNIQEIRERAPRRSVRYIYVVSHMPLT
jgi:hypothetical protein